MEKRGRLRLSELSPRWMEKIVKAKFLTMSWGQFRLRVTVPVLYLMLTVRDIEGFPIGTDEDIIALSDAPFYTACPNPFIEEFIEEYGHPYDPEKDDYHRESFAVDVSEGKNDPIYNAHSYHTKVPYKAIMRYILHYTDPNDIVCWTR